MIVDYSYMISLITSQYLLWVNILQITMKPERNSTKSVRQTKEENITSLNSELHKLTWDNVINEGDVNKAYGTFIYDFTYT